MNTYIPIGKKDVKNTFDKSKQLGAVISQVMPNGPDKLKIEDVENVGDVENFIIVFEIQNRRLSHCENFWMFLVEGENKSVFWKKTCINLSSICTVLCNY